MSSGGANILDIAEVAKGEVPAIPASATLPVNPTIEEKRKSFTSDVASIEGSDISQEDLKLRRVRGKIPWQVISGLSSIRLLQLANLTCFPRLTPSPLLNSVSDSATTVPL
jgi:hypothetical protein